MNRIATILDALARATVNADSGNRRRTATVILVALLLAVSLPAAALARKGCRVCGMYIDQYQATATRLVTKEGTSLATCGVACMIRLVDDHGGPDAFTTITVRDWRTGGEVEADAAVYVIGSDVVPDMLPTIIAFADRAAAESFVREHGGAILSFTQALMSISPMGMTMPSRLSTAVLPPARAVAGGVGYMTMVMDDLMVGNDEVSLRDYLVATQGRAMGMGPKEMTSKGAMYMLNLGLTDDLALTLKTRYLTKEMTMQMLMGGVLTEQTRRTSGFTDTDLTLRYGLWRDTTYSKFLTLLAGVSLPTGDWREAYRTMPGLQLGIGTLGYRAGLLASARFGDFWLHGEASHYLRPEYRGYDFGDTTTLALALHYTPTYDFMIGIETDYTATGKDENQGVTRGTSGGERANVAVVSSWRFLTALGGNFNLKVTAGVPYYTDVNDGGLGTGYFANVMLSFKRRLPPF